MHCPNCGNKLEENSNFCDNCGNKIIKEQPVYCTYCGKKISSNDLTCPHCGKRDFTNINLKTIVLCTISILIPICGLFLFLLYQNKDKKLANLLLTTTLISWLVWIIIRII